MDQSEWFNEVLSHKPEGFDPYVESHYKTDEGLNYGSWDQYKGQVDFDERSVLPNEIVIDIDAEDTETARQENTRVLNFLDSNGYDYLLGDTGGTGFHIHLFFKYKGLEVEEYREVRIALYKYLKLKCREEVDAETSLWDDQPVMFDVSNSKGHLVRAFGGRKTGSECRKTSVISSTLAKEEIVKKKEVEYPARIPWCIEISKTGTDSKDLSIQEIQDKVEEVKEEEKERHEADVDASEIDTRVEGLQDARDIPASKVLDLLGIDYKKRQNFECPFHDDSDPSANIHEQDGKERLYCFADSCAEKGRAKAFNAIDIMEESGYSFRESLEKFRDAFDVDVVIGYNPHDYFGEGVKGNEKFQPKKVIEEIMQEYRFKNVKKGGVFVWDEDHWAELSDDNNIIGREVDKRIQNESSSSRRRNVREMILNEHVLVDKEDFRTPDNMIPFQNGAYDIEEQELKEHKPEYNFTSLYNVKYRPELENDDVERFLKSIMPKEEENSEARREKLKDIAGFSMIQSKINQKSPILFGKGANGKNQFVKILEKIIGRENYHKSSAKRLSNDKYEMSPILGSEMAFFDEFESVSDPASLKTLIGDETQNMRQMQKESTTEKLTSYPIFTANKMPNVDDDSSSAFYRRWEIINFRQKFTEKENDGNPDMRPMEELEEEYMSQEALDSFATDVAHRLEDLKKNPKFTNQQSPKEARKEWKKKQIPEYSFFEKYLKQGDPPTDDKNTQADFITKGELLGLVNDYREYNNMEETTKGHITRALESFPDLNVQTDYRTSREFGSRKMAYAGIKIDESHVNDVKAFSELDSYNSNGLMPYVANQSAIKVDIIDMKKLRPIAYYVYESESEAVDLLEILQNTNLSRDDLNDLMSSDHFSVREKKLQGFKVLAVAIDGETLNKLEENGDDSSEGPQRLNQWMKDEIYTSWGNETEKDIPDFLDSAEDEGFDRDDAKKMIDIFLRNGILEEPKPGKLRRGD